MTFGGGDIFREYSLSLGSKPAARVRRNVETFLEGFSENEGAILLSGRRVYSFLREVRRSDCRKKDIQSY